LNREFEEKTNKTYTFNSKNVSFKKRKNVSKSKMISDHACHYASRHREQLFADSRFRTFRPFRPRQPSRLRLLRKQGQGRGLDQQQQVLRLKADELRSKRKALPAPDRSRGRSVFLCRRRRQRRC
jgi:hypothetical protein